MPLKYITAAALFPLVLTGMEGTLAAQREIAQPLPPPAAAKLRDALTRLSRQPNDLSALLDAGEAALDLNDREAAAGFLVRAENLSPENMRLKVALGRLRLSENRPIEALREFAEAERAGATGAVMGADRGLAFDLVGDHASAQAAYRAALADNDSSAVRQRLAVSLAITGDVEGFEAALLPLLQANDRAAFRTRAFGLGILGRNDEALDIAEAMMPADMALRLAPYLRNMERLSAPQQVAAANLGIFPRTADIGTVAAAPRSVELPPRTRPGDAGDALAPSGPVMGSENRAQTRTSTEPEAPRSAPVVDAVPPTPVRVARTEPRRERSAVRTRETGRTAATDPLQRTWARPPRQRAEQPERESAPRTGDSELRPAEALPASTEAQDNVPTPVVIARADPPAAVPDPQEEPVVVASVADAFADLGSAPAATLSSGTAVDITAIEVPRETVEPEPPAHPARFWVQVATGRDRSALRFDWRRIARNANGLLEGRGPFVTSWNATNRLLAGPYDNPAEARTVVGKLAEAGVDSFRFDSAEGEVVEDLN